MHFTKILTAKRGTGHSATNALLSFVPDLIMLTRGGITSVRRSVRYIQHMSKVSINKRGEQKHKPAAYDKRAVC